MLSCFRLFKTFKLFSFKPVSTTSSGLGGEFLLLEDGSSYLLLEDNISKLELG